MAIKTATKVEVRGTDSNSLDKAIKTWKGKVAKSGTPSALRKREYYSKPGVEKRERLKESKRKNKKSRND